MTIIHKVFFSDPEPRKAFSELGIKIPRDADEFEMDESDPRWPFVSDIIEQWELFDYVSTIFTRQEIARADLLAYNSSWLNGYPEPEDYYRETTYDLSRFCKACGVGLVQKDPFYLKKEPNWGTRSVFHLNWVFDELFVRKETYEKVFKKRGYGFREVFLYKKMRSIDSCLQLIIPTSDNTISLDDYPADVCPVCKRMKYEPIVKGFFPKLTGAIDFPIFKTKENFGTGTQSFNKIFITAEIRKELANLKIKSILVPVNQR